MNSLSEVEQKNKATSRRRDPLTGLSVKLPEPCRCGSDVARIGDRHRGWLSKFTANWIEDVATKFGAPEIITLRGARL